MSIYISGSLGWVVEEVPDENTVSGVSVALPSLFLKGNQVGTYEFVCH